MFGQNVILSRWGKPLKLQLGHHGTLSSLIKPMLMILLHVLETQAGWLVCCRLAA